MAKNNKLFLKFLLRIVKIWYCSQIYSIGQLISSLITSKRNEFSQLYNLKCGVRKLTKRRRQ